jgi:hypothetical protein
VEAVADHADLVLVLDPTDVTLDGRDAALAALARLGCPDVEAFAARCPAPRGAARAQRASMVVSVDDPALAAELRAAPALARWLVSPHPEGALLVLTEDAPRAVVLRALERLGVDVQLPGSAEPQRKKSRRRAS